MIPADGAAPRMIDLERERSVGLERALLDCAGMDEYVAGVLLGVGDAEAHAVAGHHPGVADLSAGFAVERGLIEHYGTALAGFERGDLLAVLDQRSDHAFGPLGLIPEEL